MSKLEVIGKEEWVVFPDLELPAVKAKVDTGAATSSLHAFNIHTFEESGNKYVTFEVHPLQNNFRVVKYCKALVIDTRLVKSSSGDTERRYVIKTNITLGMDTWEIEVTLTNRENMGYRMLLGREAITKRFLINPDDSFCLRELSHAELDKLYSQPKTPKTGYKILLLASNPSLYSNKRIIEAGEQRGHDIRFVNIKHCYMNICSKFPKVLYRGGEILDDVDAVIPRIKPSMTFYGCSLVRHFYANGVFCLNDGISIANSRDKLRTLQILSQHEIATPTTSFAHSPLDTQSVIQMVGGAPLVVKLLQGTQGRGVVLAETKKAAESVINAFKSLHANILVQEFVKEAQGRDLRLFVVDGKVAGAMQREAAEGEFRANLHLGGQASRVKITAEERRIAVRASKVVGLHVSGVDIIRSKTGPKVLEINSSPGLEGIETVTGKDIASLMIKSIEQHLNRKYQVK